MGVNKTHSCASVIQEMTGRQQVKDYAIYNIKKSLLHLGMWTFGHSGVHFCFLVMMTWECCQWHLVGWGPGC